MLFSLSQRIVICCYIEVKMIALDFVQWGCERILKTARMLMLKVCNEKRFQLCSDKCIYIISKLTIIFGIVKIYRWLSLIELK